MTFSGLLIAELTLNQLGNSGRPGVGLLELYKGSLGQPLSQIGSVAYFFLHYAMMVAYIAQGGANVESLLSSLGLENLVDSVPGLGPLAFASACGAGLYATSTAWIERANNLLVFLVAATFLAIVGIGARTADFASLFEMSNQHADQVFSCFPILFLALVYQNVVPTVVTQLEGDRKKIVRAIVGGTTVPLLMFLAWNAVVLGNVYGSGITDLTSLDPVAALQGGAISTGAPLGLLVSAFSSLALITSVIGFTYGLLDAWTDVFALNTRGKDFETWKLPLFGLVFGPPLALSVAIPDVFYQALEYGGAFGVSTLFLVLPPIMVWKERYGKDEKPLITKPLVPFGKLALGSMWKAAGTLIVEQGLEKLGVFELIQQHLSTTHP
jgi:tyrosine-specific transport protein